MNKRGRPKGKKVEQAMALSEGEMQKAADLKSLLNKMSERNRKLFLELSRGRDEFEASLFSGNQQFYTGISKVLYLKSGKPILTKDVTKDNYKELDETSYSKMIRLCNSQIKKFTPNIDYHQYMIDVTDFFKLIAPDISRELTTMFFDGDLKNETKINLGLSLLEKGGYKNKKDLTPDTIVNVNVIAPPTNKVTYAD